MMRPALFIAAIPLLLSACGPGAEDTGRFLVAPPPVTVSVPNRLGRAELREVALPAYAESQEIGWQSPDGAVRSTPQNVWADTPTRAVTEVLARQIREASGATVIADPWPLAQSPDRRIEVRVEEMLARSDGQFRLKGTYFVSPLASYSGDILRSFDILVPITVEGPPGIAAAQSRAIQQLALRMAQLQ